MDARVAARFFRVSEPPKGVAEFADLLLTDAKTPEVEKRERQIGDGLILRLERCKPRGEFLIGEFCRKQTTNIPPQAGPKGLAPIVLGDGGGIGHVAAFRYHRPTRVLLLQTNRLSASARRISLYLAAIEPAALFTISRVIRQDAWERFKDKRVRRITLGFASPANLEALDEGGLAVARGVRMLAEAYKGVEVEVTISVGRQRKKFLSKEMIRTSFNKLLSSDAHLKTAQVRTSSDDGPDDIDMIEEHLMAERELNLPDKDPNANYQVRKAFLKTVFSDNMAYIKKHYG